MIYHITTAAEVRQAQQSGVYRPQDFTRDGFIHFSDLYQVEGTANRFYHDTPDLILLEVDPDALDVPLVYENLEGGEMTFPHVYGELKAELIRATYRFSRDEQGKLHLPPELRLSPPPLFTELPFGLPGRAFRSPMPGSRMFDPQDQVFAHYTEAHISTVVVLCKLEELKKQPISDPLERYRQAGMKILHVPTADFSAPAQGDWDMPLRITALLLQRGENVAIHCHAGVGRTGMFAACLAQDLLALPPEEAIQWVRRVLPYAVETHYQRLFVRAYRPA